MKVIIIGAGLMGVASAYYLSKQGHEVLVVDRQASPAQETSFGSACVLHPSQAAPWNHPGIAWQVLKWMGKEDSPFLLRAKAIPSLVCWGLAFIKQSSPENFKANLQLNTALANYNLECMQELLAEHPIDYAATRVGSLKVFEHEQDLEKDVAAMQLFQELGVQCSVLNQQQIFDKEPALVEKGNSLIGGIHFPEDQAGDARQFCIKLGELAMVNQAKFEFGLEVEGFNTDNKTIKSIQTSKGERTADAFVLAAGSYSPLIAGTSGLRLPVKPVKGYSITVDMKDWRSVPVMPVIDEESHVAITPLGDKLRAAGTAEITGYDTSVQQARVDMIKQQVIARYAGAENSINAGKITSWAGLRPTSVDGVPILGNTPFNNLFLNTGHGHLGWSLAMASGKLVADVVGGLKPDLDLRSYNVGRF
jgi:D-amino-acid dehydrogenase